MRKALFALALLYLLAHAACLPSTLADVDSINFALGVRDFDVARHQPHPPGYPVFIAMAKASTALFSAIGVPFAEVRGLAIWSAISGALMLPVLFLFFRQLVADRAVAAWAAVVTAMSPLYWFSGVRPLSDLTGLIAVVVAQALLAAVIARRPPPADNARVLMLGSLVAGLSIGVRSQSFVLTLPLLAVALAVPGAGLRARDRLVAVLALGTGVLLWAVPLFVASGGPQAYLHALGDQAGEDFTGVVMLWTTRSARVAIDGLKYSFFWPWNSLAVGWIVVGAGLAGALRLLVRSPGALGLLAVAFAPYAAFHLLFQETLTTRYAMPLVVPVAFLAVYALAAAGRPALHAGSAALLAWSLASTLPAARAYGERPTPASSAVREAVARSAPDGVIAMHAVMLRSEQWDHDNASGRVMREQHGREIPGLVERWRQEPNMAVTFLASPRRSDLAMLDPRARELVRSFEWGFPEVPLLGGVRPGEVQLFTLRPPGWMLGPGWALTAEIGGQSELAGAGPHRRPAIAWTRARDGSTTLMIGGRNLETGGGGTARVSIAAGETPIADFTAPVGFFFRAFTLPAGTLVSADAYLPLAVTARSTDEKPMAVSLEQFDLQPDGVPMVGAAEGWLEPEYNSTTGRTWRWMSGRASLWVRAVGRDVTLRISAESPVRYFGQAPTIRVSAGGTPLAQFTTPGSGDFSQDVRIPGAILAAGTPVVIESDRTFVPGNGDRRSLALRVYSVTVN